MTIEAGDFKLALAEFEKAINEVGELAPVMETAAEAAGPAPDATTAAAMHSAAQAMFRAGVAAIKIGTLLEVLATEADKAARDETHG